MNDFVIYPPCECKPDSGCLDAKENLVQGQKHDSEKLDLTLVSKAVCTKRDSTGLCHHYGPCDYWFASSTVYTNDVTAPDSDAFTTVIKLPPGSVMPYNPSIPFKNQCECTPDKGCLDTPVEGQKNDGDKLDLTYISNLMIEEVARVRAFGAKKYSRDNWRLGFKFNRSIAAALRHILAFKEGEDLDPESQLSHIAHAVCCLEHLMNDIKNHPENDDRYKK